MQRSLSLKTFVDLFCGLGGFHLAMLRFYLRCVFACDINMACRANYRLNFGIWPQGDIREVAEENIPDHDLLCAGLPCTTFSRCGGRKGVNDPTGQLYLQLLRICGHHRPKVLIVECVQQLETLDGGPAFEAIMKALIGWGYHVASKVLNAGEYGVPQFRKRLYVVAILEEYLIARFVFPYPTRERISLASILEPTAVACRQFVNVSDWNRCSPDGIPWEREGSGLIKIGWIRDDTQGDRIYSIKGHSCTITASTGGWGAGTGLYEIDGKIGALTPREAARCFGFPESYRLLSSRHRSASQLGNSVVVPMVIALMNQVCIAIGQPIPTVAGTEPIRGTIGQNKILAKRVQSQEKKTNGQ